MSNQIARNNREDYIGGTNKYRLEAGQLIPTASNQGVIWDTVVSETEPGITYNAAIFTCVTPGTYSFEGNVVWGVDNVGIRCMKLIKNADYNTPLNETCVPVSSLTYASSTTVSYICDLRPGDTMEFLVYQNSGGDLTIVGNGFSPQFHCKCKVIRIL